MQTDENGFYLVNYFGKELRFKVLNVLEFSSARKRMSIVVQDIEKGSILLLSKGADSVIFERLDRSKSPYLV